MLVRHRNTRAAAHHQAARSIPATHPPLCCSLLGKVQSEMRDYKYDPYALHDPYALQAAKPARTPPNQSWVMGWVKSWVMGWQKRLVEGWQMGW
jgi:hypothetical protein